jgi:hypothetical protein
MIRGQTSLDIAPTVAYNPGSNKWMTIKKYVYSTAHYIYDSRRKTALETHVIYYATRTFPAVLRRTFTICFISKKWYLVILSFSLQIIYTLYIHQALKFNYFPQNTVNVIILSFYVQVIFMFYTKQALEFKHSSSWITLNPRTQTWYLKFWRLVTIRLRTSGIWRRVVFLLTVFNTSAGQSVSLQGLSLNMETVCSSRTSVTTSQTTQRHKTYDHCPDHSLFSSPL